MEDKNDNSWVLDSLVGFLKSPVWTLSLVNFIEQKSVIFEPETEDNQNENDALEQEYSRVFNEFKKMVDTLLASHMEDLEISPEQFENACLSAKDNLGTRLHHVIFEQLWAAFNYRCFKRMMIQRNIDLQLQALELLGQKLNISSEALNASSLSPESAICEEEFEMMRQLFKRSLASNQKTDEQTKNETATKQQVDGTVPKVNTTNNNNNKDENTSQNTTTASKNVDEIEENGSDHVKVRRASSARLKESAFMNKILNNNNNENNDHDKKIEQLDNEQKMLLLMGTNKDGKEISKEELEKRQQYLRKQRDKLIELKRKERSKIITKVGEEQQSTGRPKSARALKSSLKKNFNDENDDELEKNDEIANKNDTNEIIKNKSDENKENGNGYRRMLAARLKAELIGGSIGDLNHPQTSSTPSEN